MKILLQKSVSFFSSGRYSVIMLKASDGRVLFNKNIEYLYAKSSFSDSNDLFFNILSILVSISLVTSFSLMQQINMRNSARFVYELTFSFLIALYCDIAGIKERSSSNSVA